MWSWYIHYSIHILQNLTQQASLVVQCHTYLEWRSLFCKYCQQMIHNHAFEPFREIKLKKKYLNWIIYKNCYLAEYIIQLVIYIHRKKFRNSTVSQFNVTRPSLLFSTNSNVSVKSNCFKCKYNNMFLYKEDQWPSWPLIASSIPPVLYWPTDLTWLKFIQSCLHLLRIKSHSIYYVLSQRWTS